MSAYPQGEKVVPATMRASVKKATKSFPWSQALAPSMSIFRRCPSPIIDFKRLKASSTCHLPRYVSNTTVGLNLRCSVVKTNVYSAASRVSGFTFPFLVLARRVLKRAASLAFLLLRKAQTRPRIKDFSWSTHTSQSPSCVPLMVLKWSSKGKMAPFSSKKGILCRFALTKTSPPQVNTYAMPGRFAYPLSPNRRSPGLILNLLNDSPIFGPVTYTSSQSSDGNPTE